MATVDPYNVLGVKKTASQDEIKAAYRKLAKKLHPDLNPGNKSVEDKFKSVNTAYELIGTDEARAKFDRGEVPETPFGQRSGQGPFQYYYETQDRPGARYSSTFEGVDSDLFESLFQNFGGSGTGADGQPRGSGRSRRLHDETYSMEVDFKTAALGGEREITLPSGKKLQVKIPGGIASGTKLRLQKQASGGGDAYIEITVKPSEVFKRDGSDVESELPLGIHEAVLGSEVRVPTLDGAVMLKVPAGVSCGARIRIKGKGVVKGKVRGDHYAVVKIVMPATVDDELKEVMRKWSQTHSYNPRQGTKIEDADGR